MFSDFINDAYAKLFKANKLTLNFATNIKIAQAGCSLCATLFLEVGISQHAQADSSPCATLCVEVGMSQHAQADFSSCATLCVKLDMSQHAEAGFSPCATLCVEVGISQHAQAGCSPCATVCVEVGMSQHAQAGCSPCATLCVEVGMSQHARADSSPGAALFWLRTCRSYCRPDNLYQLLLNMSLIPQTDMTVFILFSQVSCGTCEASSMLHDGEECLHRNQVS